MGYHPIVLLIGRIICGVSDSFASVVSGELIRIYDEGERTRAMLWLSSVYTFGFVIGPALNFMFTDIHFFIGSIEINYSNFIGIFMAVLLLIDMLAVNFLVHDCSKEFDLKAHLTANPSDSNTQIVHETDPKKSLLQNGNNASNESKIGFTASKDNIDGSIVAYLPDETQTLNSDAKTTLTTEEDQPPVASEVSIPVGIVLKALLSNSNTLLVFVSTMGFMSALFAASALTPLVITETLKMGVKEVSVVYAGEGIIKMVYILLMGKFCRTNRSIYNTTLLCIASQIVNCAILILLKLVHRNYNRDVFLLVLFALSITFGYSFDDVLIRVMFSNMVPSKVQSFSETLRASMSRIAIVLGSLTVTVVLPYIHWWAGGVIIMHIVFTLVFIWRKHDLVEPVEISFHDGYEFIP